MIPLKDNVAENICGTIYSVAEADGGRASIICVGASPAFLSLHLKIYMTDMDFTHKLKGPHLSTLSQLSLISQPSWIKSLMYGVFHKMWSKLF